MKSGFISFELKRGRQDNEKAKIERPRLESIFAKNEPKELRSVIKALGPDGDYEFVGQPPINLENVIPCKKSLAPTRVATSIVRREWDKEKDGLTTFADDDDDDEDDDDDDLGPPFDSITAAAVPRNNGTTVVIAPEVDPDVYELVKIEGYGKALLKGMGYKDDEESTTKGNNNAVVTTTRRNYVKAGLGSDFAFENR